MPNGNAKGHGEKAFFSPACELFGAVTAQAETSTGEWRFPYLGSAKSGGANLSGYSKEQYRSDVLGKGLAETWREICSWVLRNGEGGILTTGNFGELYEEGLALQDKENKKASGQYYTPDDVAHVMAGWFDGVGGKAVCDVACGVGNLILAYLDCIGEARAREMLGSGLLHLYDSDNVALCICVTSLLVRYGKEHLPKIHVHFGDFLSASITLPERCKVISNPPYAAVSDIPSDWNMTETVRSTKELYAAFMEKIMCQSAASVIITPYSFIGGNKFYPLRKIMNGHNGFVVSFDNVPGAIFIGRKHGIFNTNTGNSVRAAITVVEDKGCAKGFRMSPLIRFKNIERSELLKCSVLQRFIGHKRQLVTASETMFSKCDNRLENVYEAWLRQSDSKLGFHVGEIGKFVMTMPNTCRYFTVASDSALSRKGQHLLRFSDEDVYWYAMCMVNSSFAYWHWRIFDGGITYPLGLLLKLPLFFGALSDDDKMFCKNTAQEMLAAAENYIVRKSNVGVQENIKYPREYRDRINRRFLKVLGVSIDETVFDIINSNMALEINLCET